VVGVPDGASVELRGNLVPVRDGQVSLTGAPGEVLPIRLKQGALTTDIKVVLTEQGPIPEQLELTRIRPVAHRAGRDVRSPETAEQPTLAASSIPSSAAAIEASPRIELTDSTKEFD
jgi:hypothetical protein